MHKYQTQRSYSTNFLLYRTRYIPDNLIKIYLKNLLISIEEMYRNGRIYKKKAMLYGMYIKKRWGIDYEILDDKHIIFLPHSDSLLSEYFYRQPTTVAVIGGMGSGKTVTAWKIAIDGLMKMEDATVHVYNDVDGLGPLMQEHFDNIVVEQEAKVPPMDGRPKIALYNEMTERHMWKKQMSSGNIDLNLNALRRRHRNTWIIQNIITYSTLEDILKQTSTFKIFKWMDPVLLEKTKNNLPKGWHKLAEICAFFGENEGLSIIPVKKKGNIYLIHDTDPPGWLLDAHRNAVKSKYLMMVTSEKKREYFQIIEEILSKYPKAHSPQVHAVMSSPREKGGHSIDISQRQVRNLLSEYRALTKIEKDG